MSLKTGKKIDEAVSRLNKKRDKFKRTGKKALLATVSALSISAGMLGSSTQMQAQKPQVQEVPLEQLDAYLKAQRQQTTQQQYPQVYANRNAYRQEQAQQYAYGSPAWLKANGYVLDVVLSRGINPQYMGAYLDTYNYDRYDEHGRPGVTYLPRDPVHNTKRETTMSYAIYCQESKVEMYHHERGARYPGAYGPRNDTERVVQDAINTVGTIVDIIQHSRQR